MTKTPIDKAPNAETPPKRRRGGQRNNRNALRHGLQGGQLPKDAKYIEVKLNAFRRNVEDQVLSKKGEISLDDAAAIQTALRWERHGQLAQRWLRLEGESMKPADRLQFSREIARASTERDKAIKALSLGKDAVADGWDAIDAESEETSHEE